MSNSMAYTRGDQKIRGKALLNHIALSIAMKIHKNKQPFIAS